MRTSARITNSLAAAGAAVLATLSLSGQASAAATPEGVWMNDTGRGAIEIKSCDGALCGYVVWVKAGSDAYGCGKQIIGEVKESGGTWDGGWIYSPDRKRRFDVELEPQSDGNLKVTGYAGVKFLSKTMVWKPAPKDLVRCNADEAAAAPAPAEEEAPAAETKAPAKAPIKTAKVETADEAPAAAPAAKPKAKPAPKADDDDEEREVADKSSDDIQFNLEDGIEVGDLFSLKKEANGKCKIKAPYVDIIVDCDKAK